MQILLQRSFQLSKDNSYSLFRQLRMSSIRLPNRPLEVRRLIYQKKGTSDHDWRVRGIVWILFSFDHIWVFVLSAIVK